ncbi:rhodanese-like domain-containing protein [Rhodopila sp.]|uniref:rhodanese-like domain-containing protein n=1 Tax=Rhodopila sp. TaxID=2480087 RepID=UPI003D0FF57D
MVENVAPTQTWEALQSDDNAQLVDVRTDVEWNFVGVPELTASGKQAILIPWQIYPTMQRNDSFEDNLKQAGLTSDHKVYFICRTGGRSMAAAQAAQAAGFPHVFNVADGFEGAPDALGHRGATGGWKAEGLPWRQK